CSAVLVSILAPAIFGSFIFFFIVLLTPPSSTLFPYTTLFRSLLTALQADIRIAADDSQFGIPAARLGLGYGFSGVTALLGLVTPAQAAEILFSARRFPAAEALQMGLVNRVVPPGDLREEVMSLAAGIAANAPLTVTAAKAAIRAAARPPQPHDLARVEAMIEACFR